MQQFKLRVVDQYKYGLFEDAWGVKEYKVKRLHRPFFWQSGTWVTLESWNNTPDGYTKMKALADNLKSRGFIVFKV